MQVARLAGLPPAAVDRARTILSALEKGDREGPKRQALIDDLPLFAARPAPAAPAAPASEVETRLRAIHPDDLSPKDALNLVYELKRLLS